MWSITTNVCYLYLIHSGGHMKAFNWTIVVLLVINILTLLGLIWEGIQGASPKHNPNGDPTKYIACGLVIFLSTLEVIAVIYAIVRVLE